MMSMRYQYTYADPTAVGPRPRMQREFWIPKGRKGGRWEVTALPVERGEFKAWRLVKAGHSHKDKLAHGITMRDAAGPRDRYAVCAEYCDWAKARGLTSVTVYRDDTGSVSYRAARERGLDRREVSVADHIGPAPVAEVCRD